jgi:hypothetical protein
MNVSNEQILAAAVGKAIAESVTPELTAQVFTEAFEGFMTKPISTYGNDKTTRAAETLQAALKAVLTKQAEAFLARPEQAQALDAIVAEVFKGLIESGKLQAALRQHVTRIFENISLR